MQRFCDFAKVAAVLRDYAVRLDRVVEILDNGLS